MDGLAQVMAGCSEKPGFGEAGLFGNLLLMPQVERQPSHGLPLTLRSDLGRLCLRRHDPRRPLSRLARVADHEVQFVGLVLHGHRAAVGAGEDALGGQLIEVAPDGGF